VVISRVWGISQTVKRSSVTEATVRLTPSRATEPFSTTNGAIASGRAKASTRCPS